MIAKFLLNESLPKTLNYNVKQDSTFLQSNTNCENNKDFLNLTQFNKHKYTGRSKIDAFHCLISPPPKKSGEDFTNEDYLTIIDKYIDKMKLNDFDYIAYLHQDKKIKHIHIVVSPYERKSGKQFDISAEYIEKRSVNAGKQISKEMKLDFDNVEYKLRNSTKKPFNLKTHNEVKNENGIKDQIVNLLDNILKQKPKNNDEFFNLMDQNNIKYFKYYNKTTKELRGYAIIIDERLYNISNIDKNYTLFNLNKNKFGFDTINKVDVKDDNFKLQRTIFDINTLIANTTSKDDFMANLQDIGYNVQDKFNEKLEFLGYEIKRDEYIYFYSKDDFENDFDNSQEVKTSNFQQQGMKDIFETFSNDIIDKDDFLQKMINKGYTFKSQFDKQEDQYIFKAYTFTKNNQTFDFTSQMFNEHLKEFPYKNINKDILDIKKEIDKIFKKYSTNIHNFTLDDVKLELESKNFKVSVKMDNSNGEILGLDITNKNGSFFLKSTYFSNEKTDFVNSSNTDINLIKNKLDFILSNYEINNLDDYFKILKQNNIEFIKHFDKDNNVRGYSITINNNIYNSYLIGRNYCLNNLKKSNWKIKTKSPHISQFNLNLNEPDLLRTLKQANLNKNVFDDFKLYYNSKTKSFSLGLNDKYLYQNKIHFNNTDFKILNEKHTSKNVILVENINDAFVLIRNGVKTKIICLNGYNNINKALQYIRDNQLVTYLALQNEDNRKLIKEKLLDCKEVDLGKNFHNKFEFVDFTPKDPIDILKHIFLTTIEEKCLNLDYLISHELNKFYNKPKNNDEVKVDVGFSHGM